MKKILMHIGTSKTGSSSIQATLSRAVHEKTLGALSYFQPKAESKNFMAALYLNRPLKIYPEIAFRHKDLKVYKRTIENYRNEFLALLQDSESVIISAESLATLQSDEVGLLMTEIERAGYGQMRVIVYIRNPIDHYLSSMQQLLKTSTVVLDPHTYNYRIKQSITAWTDSFGGDVLVRPYDKQRLKDSCVVCDFLWHTAKFFNISLEHVKSLTTNESLSAEGMIILNHYRRLLHAEVNSTIQPDVEKLISYLLRSKRTLPQTTPSLVDAIKNLIANRHSVDLAWLQHNYGIAFPELTTESGCANDNPHFSQALSDLGKTLADFSERKAYNVLYNVLNAAIVEDVPAAEATVCTTTKVNFLWEASSGATRYQLQVRKVSNDSLVINPIVAGTSYSQTGFLVDGTQYKWRVRAGNASGWSAWSAYSTFTSVS